MGYSSDGKEGGSDGKEGGKDCCDDIGFAPEIDLDLLDSETAEVFKF